MIRRVIEKMGKRGKHSPKKKVKQIEPTPAQIEQDFFEFIAPTSEEPNNYLEYDF
jgi:hypothetical protein